MKILWIGLVLSSVVACSKATIPLPDKTTSWLRACDADAECGSELACLCGICSRSCESAANCRGDTRCIQADDLEAARACGDEPAAPALCASTCSRDADCRDLGSDHTCRNGLCAAPAAPPQEVACKSGEINMERCDFTRCTGLNETAVTRCENGRFSPCECVVPREGCAALDCAAGYRCYAGKCLPSARCTEQACDEGFSCWEGSVCGQVLASDQPKPYALALDGEALYFTNRGTVAMNGNFQGDSSIERVNLASGERAQLAGDKNPIRELVVDDTRAYWFSEGNADEFQLMSVPLRDGRPNAFLGGVLRGDSLVANGASLYWIDRPAGSDSHVSRAPKDGSDPSRPIAARPPSAAGLVIHRDHLYFADEERLWRANLDGSEVTQVADVGYTPRRLTADDDAIYWLWGTGVGATGVSTYDASTGRRDVLGMEPNDRNLTAAIAIAAFGDTVFWLVESEDGYVLLNRTDKQTGETRYVWGTMRLKTDSRMVVNQDSIFVTNPGTGGSDGEVLRIVNWW